MKADPSRQWRLLDLQALDTRSAQIAHRRRTLPEEAAHASAAAELSTVDDSLVAATTALEDVRREIAKAEDDVRLVRERAERNRSRLDEGQGSAKDLQGMQHELESLARRQDVLEDAELEVMERAEGIEAEVAELTARRERLATGVEEAAAARDRAVAGLDSEQRDIDGRRAGVADGVGEDLLALYEKIRAQTGMGAAALSQRRCEGCRLELLGADLRRITEAPQDEVVRCEECRRILVRTAESGL
ncbi:zinc ribbon domain-containing protein [Agilicoccus flavus]|uniref:zinc ribbon domain-containing protein n=1 Tax=Agilicoccus flavus TaxID=2775968 RepID=UPI001CF67CFB|nr:C4-type zinc ribbon domain-containing protein [Agilicoccus flavus]